MERIRAREGIPCRARALLVRGRYELLDPLMGQLEQLGGVPPGDPEAFREIASPPGRW